MTEKRRQAQKSKAEQLARTRRNQQRCRERKRTHVVELERQVEALQTKIQRCEPCASPSPAEHESALDTAIRENAARQDLLLALGFDDETQQRFIESAAKRQAVYTILQGAQDGASLSLEPSVHSIPSSGHSINPPSMLPTTLAIEQEGVMQTENLDLPSETLDESLMDPFSDGSWLTAFDDSCAKFAQETTNGLESVDSMPARAAFPLSPLESRGNSSHGNSTPITEDTSRTNQSIERCFLNTVVQIQPGEPTTACSTALAMVFRHNRKGYSMAELQKQLRPGVREPSGKCGECCIENSVLFRVLADIST